MFYWTKRLKKREKGGQMDKDYTDTAGLYVQKFKHFQIFAKSQKETDKKQHINLKTMIQ